MALLPLCNLIIGPNLSHCTQNGISCSLHSQEMYVPYSFPQSDSAHQLEWLVRGRTAKWCLSLDLHIVFAEVHQGACVKCEESDVKEKMRMERKQKDR